MAAADYCSCKVCGGKAFYDAHLSFDDRNENRDGDLIPDYCGDYAGLCEKCAETHKLTAVPAEPR